MRASMYDVLCFVAAAACVTLALAQSVTPQAACDPADATNPLCSVDYSATDVQSCTQTRCASTTTATITSVGNGWCNGDPATEASATCATLLSAYNLYFACVLRAIAANASDTSAFRANITRFLNTPGYPYVGSSLAATPHAFYQTQVIPRVNLACASTSDQCCSQSPATTWIGDTGKGYNHVLCGNGCITALLMSAFTIISIVLFAMCSCFWPSPSLKTTVERFKAEEAAAQQAVPSSPEDEPRDMPDTEEENGVRLPQQAQAQQQPQQPQAPNETTQA